MQSRGHQTHTFSRSFSVSTGVKHDVRDVIELEHVDMRTDADFICCISSYENTDDTDCVKHTHSRELPQRYYDNDIC
jgi:hypothetical protein